MIRSVRAYWWNPVPNFGDGLTPLLLRRFAGIEPEWSPIKTSEVIVVGSVLDCLPRRYQGIILGAGKIREGGIDLRRAQVLALRGPLTWEGSGAPDCPYADPGLLAPMLLDLSKRQARGTAVIPYGEESIDHPGTVLDLRTPPIEFIDAVARHRKVVSSSLHGLILADALGMPRRWVPGWYVPADEFKFRDYAAAMGTSPEPHVWVTAPRDRVEEAQDVLISLFRDLRTLVRA